VSVVLPNYNRVAPLRRAIQSVIQQTIGPREIIIVDDWSDQEKFEQILSVVSSAQRESEIDVRLLRNTANMGANYSRNRGIWEAKGKYIAFLDSDDLWLPTKLSTQILAVTSAKNDENRPILSATGRYRVNSDGKVIARQCSRQEFSFESICRSNFVGTLSSVLVETSAARAIDGFDERLPACQDWDFFIRLAKDVKYVGVSDRLCIYVDHDHDRITANHKLRLQAHFHIYRNYICNSSGTINKDIFFRNIAEDFQAVGRGNNARRFYARSLSQKLFGTTKVASLAELVLGQLFRIIFVKSIKGRRYRRYKNSLLRQIREKSCQAEVWQVESWLARYMRIKDVNDFS